MSTNSILTIILLWSSTTLNSCSGGSVSASHSSNDSLQSFNPGLNLVYDTDSLLFKKVWYSLKGEVDSVKMYDIQGKEISAYLELSQINAECVSQIRTLITNEFNWKNVSPQDGTGTVIVSFFLVPETGVQEVRILRGVHRSLNNEVKRSVSSLTLSSYDCAKNPTKPVHLLIGIKI